LGLALKNSYQFEDAIKSYKRAIELDPTFAKAYNNLGSAYKNTRQFTAAIVCY
jgi:Flp pilus assembly protein TadD